MSYNALYEINFDGVADTLKYTLKGASFSNGTFKVQLVTPGNFSEEGRRKACEMMKRKAQK
jgi:hypothetical protein